MIIDCFSFFNEFELLELRLNELKNVVDYTVIVESSKTHSFIDKPLYFEQIKHKFKSFNILNLIVEFDQKDNWKNENKQRNFALNAISQISKDENDIVIMSDLDEIPKANVIASTKQLKNTIVLKADLHPFYLNYRVKNSCQNSIVLTNVKTAKEKGLQTLRNEMPTWGNTIENAGWHFSYQGGVEKILEKFKSFSHADDYDNRLKKYTREITEEDINIDLQNMIQNKICILNNKEIEHVELLELPSYLRYNQDKFKKMLWKP
jgi:beta-1,4-mannosyl-glycoprotein beta-1,4-N-acetylglucosaminyltransferase